MMEIMWNVSCGSLALLSTSIFQTLLFSLLVQEQNKSEENYNIINRVRIYNTLCNIVVFLYYFKNYVFSI